MKHYKNSWNKLFTLFVSSKIRKSRNVKSGLFTTTLTVTAVANSKFISKCTEFGTIKNWIIEHLPFAKSIIRSSRLEVFRT